jgi:dTDP-glucose 4,6-dehydratase
VKHIRVTGGAGFIGSNFVRLALRERPGVRVTNLDALTYSGNLENLAGLEKEPRYRFVKGDICDAAVVERLVNECDAVVHMAAESHVDRSIMDAGPFVRANVLGTQVVLDAVRKAAAKPGGAAPRTVYVSTDEVYGSLTLEPRSRKFTEETPLAPNSPYAASKAGGDVLARAYHHVRAASDDAVLEQLRAVPVPGEGDPALRHEPDRGQPVPLYGDGHGTCATGCTWMTTASVLAVLERGRPGGRPQHQRNNERSV